MANYGKAAAVIFAAIALTSGCRASTSERSARGKIEGMSRTGLHYIVEGSGPPVVLVHAFQMDAREWDEIAPTLAAEHRVIRYDVRGHGRSASATQPIAAHDDLRDLLDELNVEHASLVGLSMGSGIVLDAALAYPDRVDRVVMVSPTVDGLPTVVPFDWMTPIIAQVRAGAKDSAAALWWASSMMAGTRARGAAGERYHQVVLDNARIWGENRANRLPLAPPAGQRLESLTKPLLVVVGQNDAAGIRQLAVTLTTRVKDARALTIRNAGHMISVERPEQLADLLLRFLEPDQ
jgi:2-succinyl-6-hydroxy-2,4-cyclohexadiene-1-carboxylate synthase